MIIVQNSEDARKLLDKDSKHNSSEFSSIENSFDFKTGSKNLELDELVKELEKESF